MAVDVGVKIDELGNVSMKMDLKTKKVTEVFATIGALDRLKMNILESMQADAVLETKRGVMNDE